MAKRAGKAANRKARQRRVHRPTPPISSAAPTPIPPVGTPDAREAVSLDPPRRSARASVSSFGSTLTDRERAEYHYVERDLRNIGILTAVMVALLIAAYFVFRATGLVG
jgi:hypothetical protein